MDRVTGNKLSKEMNSTRVIIKSKYIFCKYCQQEENNYFEFILQGNFNNDSFDDFQLNCVKCKSINIDESCIFCNDVICIRKKWEYTCKKCQKVLKAFICPDLSCNYFFRSFLNVERSIVQCLNKECCKKFSLFNCLKCFRSIVYNMDKNQFHEKNMGSNIMVSSLVIKCPYEDCLTMFAKFTCKICLNNKNFKDDTDFNGKFISCKKCFSKYSICFCIYCKRQIYYKQSFLIEGKLIICPYEDCKKKSNLVRCTKCKRINSWFEDKVYYVGQKIICAYEDCNNEFEKIICPSCGILYDLCIDENNFKFGVNNKCQCGKNFTYSVCICGLIMIMTRQYMESQGIKCFDKNCNREIYNCYCPHCNNLLILLRSSYRFGMTIECPYDICAKRFNYLFCKECGKGIYFRNNDYIEGQSIKCNECKILFNLVNCSCCERGMLFSSTKDIFSTKMYCIYNDCKKPYYLGKIHEDVYYAYGFKFHIYGSKVNFSEFNKYFFK